MILRTKNRDMSKSSTSIVVLMATPEDRFSVKVQLNQIKVYVIVN